MARKRVKEFSRTLLFLLFSGVLWTFFQPAFEIRIPGFPAKSWSSWELGRSCADSALQALPQNKNKMEIPIDLRSGFSDFLKRLFTPEISSGRDWQQWAALILGLFIPIALALAYVCLLLGAAAAMIHPKVLPKLTGIAVLASSYAVLGVFYLGREAERLFQETVERASHGIFGFISKSFVPQMSMHPCGALYSLPVLALLIWALGKRKH